MARNHPTDPTLEEGAFFDEVRVDSKGRQIVTPRTEDALPLVIQSSQREGVSALEDHDVMILVLNELRVISTILASGLNVTDDLDTLRRDEGAALRDLR